VPKDHAVPIELVGNEGAHELSVGDVATRRSFSLKESKADGDEVERRPDKFFGLWGPIYVDGSSRPEKILADKIVRHDIGQAEVMVRMKVREKDGLDLLGFDAGL